MTLFIAIHFFICVFLVGVILIQPGKGDAGIGFGSSSQSIFGSKGAGNFLTKTTSVCAVLFLMTSFFLTRSRMQQYNKSVIKASAAGEPTAPVPSPSPAAEAGKADTAKAASAKAPEAPVKAVAPKANPAKKAGN